jgi:hypothetical protein
MHFRYEIEEDCLLLYIMELQIKQAQVSDANLLSVRRPYCLDPNPIRAASYLVDRLVTAGHSPQGPREILPAAGGADGEEGHV